jgi:Phage tail assembly chaperone protein
MPEQNGLYSFKGEDPTFLPHRITLSDGRSRTDNTTFTDQEIADAGFTGPYERPEYNTQTQEIIWNGETLSWDIIEKDIPQPVEPTEEELFFALRRKRNHFLFESDWTQLQDSPLSEENKEKWKTYRQKLRDLPSTIENIREYDIYFDFPLPNF